MIFLAGACVVIGLAAPLWPVVLRPVVAAMVPGPFGEEVAIAMRLAAAPLMAVGFGTTVLLALILLLILVRRRLLAGRPLEQSVTWDCGYVAPTPRMQYTASSYAWPLVLFFRLFLRPHDTIAEPRGLFPPDARLHTHTPDLFRQWLYRPLFLGFAWLASKFRWMQQGRIQLYVLYIALTILGLMIWKLG